MDALQRIFNKDEIVFADSPLEFEHVIRHYLKYPEEKLPHIARGLKTVLEGHTYFDRAALILEQLGFPDFAEEVLVVKQNVIRHIFGEKNESISNGV